MAKEIRLPRLGWSMEEGRFVGWLKPEGATVRPGEPLFAVESDKATQEVEATDGGLLKVAPGAPGEGDMVQVGRLLGWLLDEGETAPATADAGAVASSSVAQPTPEVAVNAECAREGAAGGRSQGAARPASPRARRAAREHGVDLATVAPGGSSGRVRERDVLAAAAASLEARRPGHRKVPMPPLRRAIAARLERGRQGVIPVTITRRCDATALRAFREGLKAAARAGAVVPTLNDLLLKLTAEALHRHPMLAAVWGDDGLWMPESLDLGIAVDTDAGLLVPVVRDVRGWTLQEVAAASRRLIESARAGRLDAADMQGGCFTVTNLGGLGVDTFTPVINPPESAILGVGAITRQPVVLEDGSFAARDVLPLSLTFDHRVNDGADAARFLQTLAGLIEDPSGLEASLSNA